MKVSFKRLVFQTFLPFCVMALFAGPVLAGEGVVWTIDPLTLPQPLRQQALNSPLGDIDPFGKPASAGCSWSRLQVPTMAGLHWVDQESCDGTGALR